MIEKEVNLDLDLENREIFQFCENTPRFRKKFFLNIVQQKEVVFKVDLYQDCSNYGPMVNIGPTRGSLDFP